MSLSSAKTSTFKVENGSPSVPVMDNFSPTPFLLKDPSAKPLITPKNFPFESCCSESITAKFLFFNKTNNF